MRAMDQCSSVLQSNRRTNARPRNSRAAPCRSATTFYFAPPGSCFARSPRSGSPVLYSGEPVVLSETGRLSARCGETRASIDSDSGPCLFLDNAGVLYAVYFNFGVKVWGLCLGSVVILVRPAKVSVTLARMRRQRTRPSQGMAGANRCKQLSWLI